MANVAVDDGTSTRLQRVLSRLQNLPAIALPTDYPRPSGPGKVVEAVEAVEERLPVCALALEGDGGDAADAGHVVVEVAVRRAACSVS